MIFMNREFAITESSLICEICVQKLNSTFASKSACNYNEDIIVTYQTETTWADKLVAIYLEQNNLKCDCLKREQLNICRICINVIPDQSLSLLEDEAIAKNVGEVIKTHFPEVDLTVSNNPVVCNKCLQKLQNYGIFVESWLEIYKLKKQYCQSHNRTNISDLNEVRQFICENKNVAGDQHPDIHGINITHFKNEISIKKIFKNDDENETDRNPEVENIELKEGIEVKEEIQIKTEQVLIDVQPENYICKNGDSEVDESKENIGNVLLDQKIELQDYILKEEEISVLGVKDDNGSSMFNEDEELKQQKSYEYPSCSNETFHNIYEEFIPYEEQQKMLEVIGRVKLEVVLERLNLEEYQGLQKGVKIITRINHAMYEIADTCT